MRKRETRIGSFARIVAGGTPTRGVKTYYDGHIPWVKTLDLNCGVVTAAEEKITDAGLRSIRGGLNPPGTVMVAMYGGAGTIGKSGVLGIEAATNQAVASILPNSEVFDSRFLHYQLMHLRREWMQFSQGNRKDPNINKSVVEEMLVWLPASVAEQKTIADDLDHQFQAIAEADQAVQAQLNDVAILANKLRDQAMMDLGDFRRVPVEKVLHGIEAGKSFQTSERLASDKELGVLKVSAVSWGEFKPQEAKAVAEDYTPDDRHRIRRGDVIVSRANTIALVGAVVRAERDYPQRLLSDKTLRLILDTTQCDPDYFVEVLRLPEARTHIEANATGSSDSMRNISQGALAATPIPLPDIDEQRRLAKHMQGVNKELTALRASIQARMDEIEQLPARLLAQVFDTL